MALSQDELIKRAYEDAALCIRAKFKSPEWKNRNSSFRDYSLKAGLDPKDVLSDVRRELRFERDPHPDFEGLWKDKQGRRCWLVARNPGEDACFFIEGQTCHYHRVPEKDVLKLYTKYEPPPVEEEAPEWWDHYRLGFTMGSKRITLRRSTGYWNGWYSAEIGDKFYVLSAAVIRRHFYELASTTVPQPRLVRLAFQPDII